MKYILSVLLVCIAFQTVSAQEFYNSSGRPITAKKKTQKKSGYDPSRLIVGGGLVAGFGSGYADFGVSPVVGYRFTDRFSAGVGLGYEYLKNSYILTDPLTGFDNTYSSSIHIIYPSLWSRYFVYNNIFVSGVFEYDIQYISEPAYDNYGNGGIYNQKFTESVPCLLLGGGVRQPMGGRVSILAEMLYDVLQQRYSPYLNQPVIHFGIVAGI